MSSIGQILQNLWEQSGFFLLSGDWRQLLMIGLAFLLLYLGIVKKFEPLLLVGIAFGMLLTNLPGSGMFHSNLWQGDVDYARVLKEGGLLDILYIGIKTGVYPSLIFLGVGAMTDFGPLLANAKSLLLGAAAQLGIYCALSLLLHWASTYRKPLQLELLVALTVQLPYSLQDSWHPIF